MRKGRFFEDIRTDELPLYNVWCLMKQRCNNPKQLAYKYYGAKGVIVCPSWSKDFMLFYKWAMKRGYTKGLNIDRKNSNGNYSPKNCRLLDHKANCRNKTNTIKYTHNNITLSIGEWQEKLNMSRYQVKKFFKT